MVYKTRVDNMFILFKMDLMNIIIQNSPVCFMSFVCVKQNDQITKYSKSVIRYVH